MAKFKTGDVWDSRDASQIWDDVQMLVGYHENVAVPLKIEFGVTVAAIARDAVGDVTRWDTSVSPPVATTDVVECTFDWLSDEEIEAGKEVAYIKVGGINRILWAECNDPKPPQSARISASGADATTGVWGPIPGGVEDYNYADSLTGVPLQYGFIVLEPGYFQYDFSFSAEAQTNNTLISIRFVTGSGVSPETTWEVKSAPGSVSGSPSGLVEVTQADLDAGTVYIQVERNINNLIDWQLSQLIVTKLGAGVPV